MKLTIKKGITSKIIHIFISDSSLTDGSGLAGLLYNSAGLTAYYVRPGDATATVLTLVDITTLGTYVSGGLKEYDATNMPGIYEFHIPNACLASGADQVVIMLKGATNMAPLPLEIQLNDNTSKDIYDRVGAPAGASIAADLVVIDDFVDELETRITAIRAGYLDNLSAGAAALASVCTETRLAELDAGNIPADLLNISAYVDELETRLTAIRAGYLDNLSAGAAALASVCTACPLG